MGKIEERRKEEIELYEKDRRELEMFSFQQEIEIQKVMNTRDDIQIQLMQEQNRNEQLALKLKEITAKSNKIRERISISVQAENAINISPKVPREQSPPSEPNSENMMSLSNLEYQESV